MATASSYILQTGAIALGVMASRPVLKAGDQAPTVQSRWIWARIDWLVVVFYLSVIVLGYLSLAVRMHTDTFQRDMEGSEEFRKFLLDSAQGTFQTCLGVIVTVLGLRQGAK